MPTTNIMKTEARLSLKDKWPKAIGLGALVISAFCLIYVFFSMLYIMFSHTLGNVWGIILSLIPAFFIWQFFGVPLLYGVLRWFWFTITGEDVPVNEAFFYFSRTKEYIRSISLGFRIFCRIVAILFVCFFPSGIISVLCRPTVYDMLNFTMPFFVSSLWSLGNVLTLFGTILSTILLLRYFAAPILMINDNNISPQEALHLSSIISKQVNGKTFAFLLSFFGWAILSLLVIPLIYILPFFMASYAIYCKHLIENYNRLAELQNKTYYPNYKPPRF